MLKWWAAQREMGLFWVEMNRSMDLDFRQRNYKYFNKFLAQQPAKRWSNNFHLTTFTQTIDPHLALVESMDVINLFFPNLPILRLCRFQVLIQRITTIMEAKMSTTANGEYENDTHTNPKNCSCKKHPRVWKINFTRKKWGCGWSYQWHILALPFTSSLAHKEKVMLMGESEIWGWGCEKKLLLPWLTGWD